MASCCFYSHSSQGVDCIFMFSIPFYSITDTRKEPKNNEMKRREEKEKTVWFIKMENGISEIFLWHQTMCLSNVESCSPCK